MARSSWLTIALCALSACSQEGPAGTPDAGADGSTCDPPGLRPSQRNAHDAVLLQSGAIVVFGGDGAPFDPGGMQPAVYNDETWLYHAGCGTWDLLPAGPSPGKRGAYASAHDAKRDRMLLFGGRKNDNGYRIFNDTWAYDRATGWKQLAPTGTPPRARQSARAVYDPGADRMLVFGGNGASLFGNGVLDDTWELSFAGGPDGAWKQIMAPGPSARQDVGGALDTKRNAWVLFGGAFDFNNYDDETWSFDLGANTWRRIPVSGNVPTVRFWAELIYDPPRDRILLFGGHDDGPVGQLNDTWVLTRDGAGMGTWTNVLAGDSGLGVGNADLSSPERRTKQSLVLVGEQAWLFGGIGDCGPIDDVWTLDLASPVAWTNRWKAQVGETCARRAKPGQMCPSDCGPPL